MILKSSIREFVKNSRIPEAMRNALISATSMFFPRGTAGRTLLAFDKLMPPLTKGVVSTS